MHASQTVDLELVYGEVGGNRTTSDELLYSTLSRLSSRLTLEKSIK